MAPGLAVILSLSLSSDSSSLSAFKREAERVIGKPIEVKYFQNAGPEGGKSNCLAIPVEIRIRTGPTPGLQVLILAHELGHVIVCSRGIGPVIYTIPQAPLRAKPILVARSGLFDELLYRAFGRG